VAAAEKTSIQPAGAVSREAADERTEIVGQLHRSLALLRGCNVPGARAQISSLIASLNAQLHHLDSRQAVAQGDRAKLARLIPSVEACALQPLECRAYAIQCESLASMADSEQRRMLLALARLWRALAQAASLGN